MPVTPHPIQVTVYDTDNSTLLSGVTFQVRNITKGTELTAAQKTDANGVTELDLANLSGDTPYVAGDKIMCVVHKGNKHDAYLYTVSGDNEDLTLYLNEAKFHNKVTSLLSITTAETSGTVAYVKVYDWYDGELIAHIETPANDTKNVLFGYQGKQCRYVFVREANTLIVSATSK